MITEVCRQKMKTASQRAILEMVPNRIQICIKGRWINIPNFRILVVDKGIQCRAGTFVFPCKTRSPMFRLLHVSPPDLDIILAEERYKANFEQGDKLSDLAWDIDLEYGEASEVMVNQGI